MDNWETMIRQKMKICKKRTPYTKYNRTKHQSTKHSKRNWCEPTQNMPQTTNDTDGDMEETEAVKTRHMETTIIYYD